MSIISVSKHQLEEVLSAELSNLWMLEDNEVISAQVNEIYYLIAKFQLDAEKIADLITEQFNEDYGNSTDVRDYVRVKQATIDKIKQEFEEYGN